MQTWGSKSVVEELPDRNYTTPQTLITYLSPRHPSAYVRMDQRPMFFHEETIEFPPMLMMVLDTLFLRSALHEDVHTLEIKGNFPLGKNEANLEKKLVNQDRVNDMIQKMLTTMPEEEKKKKELEEKEKKNMGGEGEKEDAELEIEEDKKKNKKKTKELRKDKKNMDGKKKGEPKSKKEKGKSKAKKNRGAEEEGGGEEEKGGEEEEEKEKEKEKEVEVPKDPGLWISVLHRGEKVPFEPPGHELTKLLDLLNGFPVSTYVIEINNGTTKRKYTQTLSRGHGGLTDLPPTFQPSIDPKDWTRVTFLPKADGYNLFPSDNLTLKHFLWKRVTEIAATLNGRLKVIVDDTPLDGLTFPRYIWLHPTPFDLEMTSAIRHQSRNWFNFSTKDGHFWYIGLSLSNGVFQHVSFVNGLPTARGGTHVDLVKNTLIDYAKEHIDPKESFSVDNYRLFISLIIKEDPVFDSKARDCLITNFECGLTFDPKLANFLIFVVRSISGLAKQAPDVDDLVDAHEAGGEEASECYLILTEGESAKDFALSGISSVGNKYYGVLPLRGKIPNVKSAANAYSNNDIMDIKRSLGLVTGVCYSNLTSRYGHLILMMDQDTDGSHIKGLIINFFHHHWPSLLQKKDFLFHFITPIIKVTTEEKEHKFYSIRQYDKWTKTNGNHANWKTKYYKGLGSHTAEEAKQYFNDRKSHMKSFRYSGVQDFNVINLVFCPSRVNDRKYWITRYQEDTFIDAEEEAVSYADFLNKVMILYSLDDIKRSIPSMVDGLKPSQRKILFSAFKKNLVEEMKVAQFSGYVCEQCAYHHSQDSMSETIIRMAQDFVGENNINLLLPIGQFGTRRKGGKSHADARYISTCLSPQSCCIFKKDDEPLLNYLIEDGQQVQPSCYLPIIPMVLVNGCQGIATGWSTKLTQYDPREIIKNIKAVLNEGNNKSLSPWFRGFEGTVTTTDKFLVKNYQVSGVIKEVEQLKYEITELPEVEQLKYEITELPVSTNTDTYKSFLHKLVQEQKISSFQEDHKGDDLKFIVTFAKEELTHIKKKQGNLEKYLKLGSTLTTDNIYLIDWKGSLKKYLSADEILSEFIKFRLPFYQKRQELLIEQCEDEIKRHTNIEKFVREFKNGDIKLYTKGFSKQLLKRRYKMLKYDKNFKHIRKLSVDDLMSKRADQQLALIEEKGKLANLKQQSPTQLWLAELDVLEKDLKILYKKERKNKKRKGDELAHSGEKQARHE